MPDNQQLDAFLSGAPDGAPPVQEAPPPAQEAPEGGGAAAASPTQPTAQEAPEPAQVPTAAEPDEEEPGEVKPGERAVPLTAYERERGRRQDWKGRADRAEAERDALRRQLEEARRPTQPAAPAPPMPQRQAIDPARDPIGFVINQKFDVSEFHLRREMGDAKVDEYVAEFQRMAERDPSLRQKCMAAPSPYHWMAKQVDHTRTLSEMGDDPAAWREAERQRLRAELEAEFRGPANGNGHAAAPRPATGTPPSLATMRSAAPRAGATFTGPPSLDDILAGRPKTAGGRA